VSINYAIRGLKNTLSAYKYMGWLFPIFRPIFPNYFGTLKDVGVAMINCVIYGYDKKVLEARDIAGLAKRTAL